MTEETSVPAALARTFFAFDGNDGESSAGERNAREERKGEEEETRVPFAQHLSAKLTSLLKEVRDGKEKFVELVNR